MPQLSINLMCSIYPEIFWLYSLYVYTSIPMTWPTTISMFYTLSSTGWPRFIISICCVKVAQNGIEMVKMSQFLKNFMNIKQTCIFDEKSKPFSDPH